jgi:hypothetical protein
MAQIKENAFTAFEKTYDMLFSKPTFEMSSTEISNRIEVMHDVTLKILHLETANMEKLEKAIALQGDEMQLAITNLEKAATENADYLTMLQAVDQALHMVSSSFLFLL